MAMADQRTVLGYQTHYLIDGGRARIILHALAMSGDVMENQPFLDQLRRVLFRWKLQPDRVIADTKYSTIENIKALDAMGINLFGPAFECRAYTVLSSIPAVAGGCAWARQYLHTLRGDYQ